MKDVSRKPDTLRSARATATITMPADCVPLLRERRTEKGDALAAARVAGIMAVKRTPDLIPLCHPLPIQNVDVAFNLGERSATVEVEVQAIANTGVEMEALTAASVASLTLYDMLKPHAGTDLSIGDVRLLEKRGGKSHHRRRLDAPLPGAVIIVSDAVAAGRAEDRAGIEARALLADAGIDCPEPDAVPDDPQPLEASIREAIARGARLVATVGGTGVGPRDRTVETVRPLLDREIPGIMETARAHGQRRMPYAMLSRGVAGLIGQTLVLTLPGSPSGAQEHLDALIPGILHVFAVVEGIRHEAD